MGLESLDPKLLPLDEFPVLNRLHDVVAAGHPIDDVLAGFAFVQPRLDAALSAELQLLIDEKEQYDLAIELCERCAGFAPPEAKFLFLANIGHCEQKKGDDAKGLELIRDALDLVEDVDEEWAHGYRGWCYNQLAWINFKLGSFPDGVGWAEKAIEANPENWNAYGTLGSLLYELGDDRAYDYFETSMKNGVDPELPVRLKDDERYRALAEQYDIPLPQEG